MSRLNILKTYKLFIGGQFPRTESGRYYQLKNSKGAGIANVCLASRKDFRNAAVAARGAFQGWSSKSAYNRGQILYRVAEMLEGRKEQFVSELVLQGISRMKATVEVELSIDRLVYYAGWCDKYQAIFSTVNPVSSPHYNFSVPEPMGVVAVTAPGNSGLLGFISVMAPVIAGGNSCAILASETLPLCAVTFAEVLATSDLPAGVVNILTGSFAELSGQFSTHMDVNAMVCCAGDPAIITELEKNCAVNVKRFFNWAHDWNSADSQGPYLILDLQEIKTTWHPIEDIGPAGMKY
jgi:acyl-CoA reductase-like NAD-dependent aldehyde dehydrogenase